mgnify:FL=1
MADEHEKEQVRLLREIQLEERLRRAGLEEEAASVKKINDEIKQILEGTINRKDI